MYDPVIARFLSPDPMSAQAGDSQTINPYSYVTNGPLSATDPTGWATAKTKPGQPGVNYSPNSTQSFGGLEEVFVHGFFDPGKLADIVVPMQVMASSIGSASGGGEGAGSSSTTTEEVVIPAPKKKARNQVTRPMLTPCPVSGSEVLALAGGVDTFAEASLGTALEISKSFPKLLRGLGAAGGVLSAATAVHGFATGDKYDAFFGSADTIMFAASFYPGAQAATGPYFLARLGMEVFKFANEPSMAPGNLGASCVR